MQVVPFLAQVFLKQPADVCPADTGGPLCLPAGTGAAPPPHQPGVLALPRQAGTKQVSGRSQALHDSTSHTQAVWVC